MKQVIVKLKNSSNKTIRTKYYYSKSQYCDEVYDDFKDLAEGQEILVKIGNSFSASFSYEDVVFDSKTMNTSFDEELRFMLTESSSLIYYIKQYLYQY